MSGPAGPAASIIEARLEPAPVSDPVLTVGIEGPGPSYTSGWTRVLFHPSSITLCYLLASCQSPRRYSTRGSRSVLLLHCGFRLHRLRARSRVRDALPWGKRVL